MILRSLSALRVGSLLVGLVVGMVTMSTVSAMTYTPNSEIGYPAGLIPECPGVMKNATISSKMLPLLQVVHHKLDEKGQTVRIPMPITKAAKIVARDKSIDFKNKKTVFYAVGYIDSSVFPHSQAIGDSYSKLGYNVFLTETFAFLTYIYPKSARLSRTIGKKVGEFLVKLTVQQGLAAENLELVGISLGAHIMSYAAKHLYAVTGKKPSRITGLDPAGPCFRSLPPQYRLNPSDGERVDVIHTNIDGFGIAEPLGHVDIYVNGGEYQPGDILYIPCLVICSHIKAIIYWWQALEHPSKFIGVKCNSVQEARVAGCYNNTETNILGLRTNFSETGIFYLSTNYAFPYYRGKAGLKPENEIYTSVIRQINSDEDFVV